MINNKKLMGFLIPNMLAITSIGILKYFPPDGNPVIIYSEFILVPMLMGIISAWFWKGLAIRGGKLTLYSFLNTLIAIALSYIFLGEGVICLIIVSPLLVCFIIAGAFTGRYLFGHNDERLNASVISLILFIFITDAHSKHVYENEVSDTIVIHARPDKIWKNVVAFEKIKQPDNFWLFRIGLPSPMETTVTGYYKGAGRKCIFSNGYVFDERISVYEPGGNLTFDITHQPRDPEIMNHLDLVSGQFLLKDNGDGTTTLTGNSWYKLYVFPAWYYDVWAQSIVRNVHTRVMAHIKQLSEK